MRMALLALLDTLATAIAALGDSGCTALLGPLVPGTNVPLGARLPGSNRENDPANTAADIALCASWRSLHPAWLGPRPVHISENIAALLAVGDWLCRNADRAGARRLLGAVVPRREEGVSMKEIVSLWIKAAEIQGQLARELPVEDQGAKLKAFAAGAMAATSVQLLGGDEEQILSALNLALAEGPTHPPSAEFAPIAAANAASRAVVSAARALSGLTVSRGEDRLRLSEPLGSTIVEQTLFNIAFPDFLSAQTALECAVRLHLQARERLGEIERVEVATHGAALEAPNGACPGGAAVAHAVAVGLLHGRAEEAHFGAAAQNDPLLSALGSRVLIHEDPRFTEDYRDADKQALPNAVQILFRDGSRSERIAVEYPLGHYKRHTEAVPLVFGKAEANLRSRFDDEQADDIIDLFDRPEELLATPADRFVDLWIGQGTLGA